LGERIPRTDEVRGSSPLGSTTPDINHVSARGFEAPLTVKLSFGPPVGSISLRPLAISGGQRFPDHRAQLLDGRNAGHLPRDFAAGADDGYGRSALDPELHRGPGVLIDVYFFVRERLRHLFLKLLHEALGVEAGRSPGLGEQHHRRSARRWRSGGARRVGHIARSAGRLRGPRRLRRGGRASCRAACKEPGQYDGDRHWYCDAISSHILHSHWPPAFSG
jgi:hypothetical protein